MKTSCPQCGAGERLGVWFPKRKIEILDKIIAAKESGASFDGIDLRTLKAHVSQLNDILASTDWRIRSAGWGTGRYRLVKVAP